MNQRNVVYIRSFAVLVTTAGAAFCLSAQQPACQPASLIHTHAMAHIRLPNTVADGSVGISADASSVAAVTRELGLRSQKMMAFLRDHHGERLATQQISVEPKTHTVKGGPDQIVGYSGRMSVSFRTSVDAVSDLVSGALANGANTLDAVSFSPREEELDAARRSLAIEATRTAAAQADAVAKAAGEHVSSIHDISVDPEGTSLRMQDTVMRSSLSASSQPMPMATQAGDQEISVTVNIDANIAQ